MPTISIPGFTDASLSNPEDLFNRLQQMSKALSYLMGNLDENNISRIVTDVTEVKSAKGETVIDGPQIKMYDTPASDPYDQRNFSSTGQLRVELGYDSSTGDFVFEMFSKAGLNTLNLDSEGEFVWNGNFTFMDRTDNNLAVMTFSNLGSGLGYQILSLNGANLEVGAGPGGSITVGADANETLWLKGGTLDVSAIGTINTLLTQPNETGSGGTPAHTHSIPNLIVSPYPGP